MGHLDPDMLAGYIDGQLSEIERAEAERHIDACASCRSELSELAAMGTQAGLSSAHTIVHHDDPLIGTLVGSRYRVVRKLGQGGMGAIYEVMDEKLKRSFALKTLSPSVAASKEAMARFQREAEVIAALRHPNIVEISDREALEDGSPCMILEFLRGTDLAQRIARGTLGWDEIARIADQVMAALTVAHRAGVVHRDLKPGNIFLAIDDGGDEHVKLLDFGVSKLRDSRSQLTNTEVILGTPVYMSPEQALGNAASVGPSTDVWAMGAILHEMASGQLAFMADNIPAILLKITTTPPTRLRRLRPDTPAAFAAAVEAALSLDPRARIQTIEDLRARIRAALAKAAALPTRAGGPAARNAVQTPATTLSHAAGVTWPVRDANAAASSSSGKSRRRRRVVVAASSAVVVATLGIVAVFATGYGEDDPAQPAAQPAPPAAAAPAPVRAPAPTPAPAPAPVPDPPVVTPAPVPEVPKPAAEGKPKPHRHAKPVPVVPAQAKGSSSPPPPPAGSATPVDDDDRMR